MNTNNKSLLFHIKEHDFVGFLGTLGYASLNTHYGKDQGMVDDLWGWFIFFILFFFIFFFCILFIYFILDFVLLGCIL
jgi:uncharacterized membrane protein